jgi:hypothetical protein
MDSQHKERAELLAALEDAALYLRDANHRQEIDRQAGEATGWNVSGLQAIIRRLNVTLRPYQDDFTQDEKKTAPTSSKPITIGDGPNLYEVELQRSQTIQQSVWVNVRAEDQDEAEERAIDAEAELDWQQNDEDHGGFEEPTVNNCEQVSE